MTTSPLRLALIRHGQSEWNLQNRFTGWVDVDLTEKGVAEAQKAGQLLADTKTEFSACFTSVQKRAIRTLWLTLSEMNRMWLPVTKDWRLNERHYGGLTGLDKQETRDKHGTNRFISGGAAMISRPRRSTPTARSTPIMIRNIRIFPRINCPPRSRSKPHWIGFNPTGKRIFAHTSQKDAALLSPHTGIHCAHWSSSCLMFPMTIFLVSKFQRAIPY